MDIWFSASFEKTETERGDKMTTYEFIYEKGHFGGTIEMVADSDDKGILNFQGEK
jgi:hypothetical protein